MAPVDSEDAPDPSVQDSDLDDGNLRSFESAVCDQKGLWINFDKIVPTTDDAVSSDPKAKKPPAKGKAANPEDTQKPTHGRAWLNLTPFLTPGTKTLTQRVFLSQIAPSESGYPVTKRDDESIAMVSNSQVLPDQSSDQQTSLHDVFMEQQTYAYITVELTDALLPMPDYNVIKADGRGLTDKYP